MCPGRQKKNIMQFLVVGLDHQSCSMGLREQVHFTDSQKLKFQVALTKHGLDQSVILSTCNRVELFFMGTGKEDLTLVCDVLRDFFKVEALEKHLRCFSEKEALRHLFRLTMGLESLVVGEDQILGQVKAAYEDARDWGFCQRELNKIFLSAITFGKKVKKESGASDYPTSVAYLGHRWLKEQQPFAGEAVLLVGVGQMGRLALTYLSEEDCTIFVANRTLANSLALKKEFPKICVIEYEKVPEVLNRVTRLVTSTSSPHLIFTEKDFRDRQTPLLILDLSLPRDVHPLVGNLPNITLGDMETMKSVSCEHSEKKRQLIESMSPKMETAIDELESTLKDLAIHSLFEKSQTRCEDIADHTLDYIYRKTTLKEREKIKVEKVVHWAVQKAMLETWVKVKEQPDSQRKRQCIQYLEEILVLENERSREPSVEAMGFKNKNLKRKED